ncbi:MAG: cation-translocating P-type ATPase [Lachnospiraceae bacterium]|nr:cation-translocating P-type ATPase [Lachnospiraceae bacterium]
MKESKTRQRENGLTQEEARRRLEEQGANVLTAEKERTRLQMFLAQLNDPLIYVLLAAAVLSACLGEWADAAIIGVVVFLNAFVGMLQEGKARKALDALRKMAAPHAVVVRDGIRREIPAAQLVVGDLVCLETGCQVPADLRLTQTTDLQIEESAFTGETLPVKKDADAVPETEDEESIPLGDRRNRAFMTTVVTGGRGEGIVTETGMDTQIGRIASMVSGDAMETTPLQRRLSDLGKLLSILSLLLCGILFVLAMVQQQNVLDMLLVAISLAVAVVPEGLPAVVTICLALSVTRMVKVNAIIRRLPSVETLGSVTVVCTDKTGTLTQNRMTVECCMGFGAEADLGEGNLSKELLRGMVLCNNAQLHSGIGSSIDDLGGSPVGDPGGSPVGDPMELALLEYGARFDFDREETERYFPRRQEIPFDSERKMMTTFHEDSRGRKYSFVKGAPDLVLKRCVDVRTATGKEPLTEIYRAEIEKAMEHMAQRALRMLAVAMYEGGGEPTEERLTFLGLLGMRDPVRQGVGEAIEVFCEAGVKTVMVTGDHRDTAFCIARELHIAERPEQCLTGEQLQHLNEEELAAELIGKNITVFARVSPMQKLRIIQGFQNIGEVVAMTGDGVNDAPALKNADIGIAMGQNGTDVARQAADVILADDHFATIEKAIEEGRSVYENIRKSVIFLLSSNFGEILTMFVAVVLQLATPLKSGHILWINLITDSLPALALGMDTNDAQELMKTSPRNPRESLFSRGGLMCTLFYGFLIAGISLAAFALLPCALLAADGQRISLAGIRTVLENEGMLMRAQTYTFTVLSMSQLFHAVGMRDTTASIWQMRTRPNRMMTVAVALGILLQLAVTRLPILVECFGTVRLSGAEWLMLAGLASMPLLAHEILVLTDRLFALIAPAVSGRKRQWTWRGQEPDLKMSRF